MDFIKGFIEGVRTIIGYIFLYVGYISVFVGAFIGPNYLSAKVAFTVKKWAAFIFGQDEDEEE